MTGRDVAAPWTVETCTVCRGKVIRAVDVSGTAIVLDAAPSQTGSLGLTERGAGMRPLALKPKAGRAFGRPMRDPHPSPCYPVSIPDAQPRPRREPEKPKAKIAPHPFERDETISREPFSGNYTCKRCLALGRPGDIRHPDPAQSHLPNRISEAAERDAAVLGEKRDDS